MMNFLGMVMGFLFLVGGILTFKRKKGWGVAVQIAGATLLLVGGIMGVFGPGDVVFDFPGHSAERQMRYIEIVGYLSCAGLIIFAIGYFIDGIEGFRSKKSEMK